MRILLFVLATALGAGLASDSFAASPGTTPNQPGRYAMQPTEGGFLRLDTATGDVSLCAKANGAFECKPVKDDRDLQAELARLSDENKALKAEIKRQDQILGLDGDGPDKSVRKFELPSEQDVEKALNYVERMLKKFRDKLKDFENQPGERKGTPL